LLTNAVAKILIATMLNLEAIWKYNTDTFRDVIDLIYN